MREYTQLINACLSSMNLPAALDDVTQQNQCPASIQDKSAKVKNNGGISAISAKNNELPALYKRNEEILNETSRLIKEEKENDDGLRVQFQSQWTRVPSENLTAPLVQELGKYRGIMHTASNSDALVRSKFEANRRGIELLSLAESQLKNAIPGIGANKGHANSSTVNTLRNLLDQVQEIKVERENIEKELKKIRCDMSNEFAKALSKNGVINEEKLSLDKIQDLFVPLKERIDQSIKRQETVMAEIERCGKRFVEERHAMGGAERENLLRQLATSYDAFIEIQTNLSEGTKFYNDLNANLVRLQQKVSDFCFARQTEKEDLMKQVQQTGDAVNLVGLLVPDHGLLQARVRLMEAQEKINLSMSSPTETPRANEEMNASNTSNFCISLEQDERLTIDGQMARLSPSTSSSALPGENKENIEEDNCSFSVDILENTSSNYPKILCALFG